MKYLDFIMVMLLYSAAFMFFFIGKPEITILIVAINYWAARLLRKNI